MLRVILVALSIWFSCTQGQLIAHSCSISCLGKVVGVGTQECNCNALEEELEDVRSLVNKLKTIVLADWLQASNGRWYRLFSERKPYQEAAEICRRHGAILASAGMKNLAISREIMKMVGIKKTDVVWIGLNDLDIEGRWMWEDGSSDPVVNWNSVQPDNYRGNEDCGQTWTDFTFNDGPCDILRRFLCETDKL